VTEAGSLIINTVKANDKGFYVCAAVNSAGSTLKKAALHVEIDGWFCLSVFGEWSASWYKYWIEGGGSGVE
jgi:hypothetical protein